MSDQNFRDDGYIGISEAAKLAGIEPRRMRKRLRALHRRHGSVLFRFADAVNAKLWTTPQALQRVMPERFDEVSQLDLIELRSMVLDLQNWRTRTERRLVRLEAGRRPPGAR